MKRQPCPSCPWRIDQDATAIPNFKLELAEKLAATCGEPGNEAPLDATMFACHQSRPEQEVACAGWLAAVGVEHLGVRLAVATGRIPAEALRPDDDWPELHGSFAEVIAKLRATNPANVVDPEGTV